MKSKQVVLIKKVPCQAFLRPKFIFLNPGAAEAEMDKAKGQDLNSITKLEAQIVVDDSGKQFISVDTLRKLMDVDVEIRD